MKKCITPGCAADYLYRDESTVCPFCHGTLVWADGSAEDTGNIRQISEGYLRSIDRLDPPPEETEETFLCKRFGILKCTGRITEIDHQELFHSTAHKLFNTLFLGEPYQFGHQNSEYSIRLENITNGISTETTDFCLFGNYMGRIQVGDEVQITASPGRGRRVVKKIYNRTTASPIYPGLQVPAWCMRILFLSLFITVGTFLYQIIMLFVSGAVSVWLKALFAAVLPVLTIAAAIIYLIISILPGRRRR
ncbi:MAG: hypothetical protein IJ480_09865 [Clostridia bacterium]|nr:hypothetical protein [Clostridia bacterium]